VASARGERCCAPHGQVGGGSWTTICGFCRGLGAVRARPPCLTGQALSCSAASSSIAESSACARSFTSVAGNPGRGSPACARSLPRSPATPVEDLVEAHHSSSFARQSAGSVRHRDHLF
jgi:hypothetical protein